MRLRLAVLAAFCAAAFGSVPAAPAGAANGMESIFEDHYLLVQQGPAVRARSLDDMLILGADTIRSLVYWRDIAPDAGRRKMPDFDAANPAAYPAGAWDPYDDLVRGVDARGMSLLLSPGAPLPAWGSTCGKVSQKVRRSCRPHAKRYGDFVRALATRYSGAYADENQGGGVLPRVRRWSIWNEPNQPGWLYPQYERRGGRTVVTAARLYRALARQAIKALRATGHGADQVLLGELAPLGRTSGKLAARPSPPAEFVRDLFCMDSRGRRLRGSSARARGCSGSYPRFAVSGFAHHPYTRGGSQPPRARALPNEITISSASRLKKLLDQGARARRIPRGLPIFYTEFGYQTNPPDRLFGVTLAKQSEFLNESDWIAFQDRRVRSVAQYKLVDEGNVANFQTGLRFAGGRNKPAFDAYRLPLWVKRSGANVKVYGQIRPAADNARELVFIQNSPKAGEPFTSVHTVEVTSVKGHFLVEVPSRPGRWRLAWTPSGGGATVFSREAKAAGR